MGLGLLLFSSSFYVFSRVRLDPDTLEEDRMGG